MIFATRTVSLSALNTRPVTSTLAPVKWPILAAVSVETVPDNPSSCSPRTFSSSTRSTIMSPGSEERFALMSAAVWAPRSRTASSLASKLKTATVNMSVAAERAVTPAASSSAGMKVQIDFMIRCGFKVAESANVPARDAARGGPVE